MTTKNNTLVCIINFNGWRDTVDCVQSLINHDALGHNDKILVIDNASSNDSVNFISVLLPHIEVIQLGTNLGFGGGNNVGFEYAKKNEFENIWLLNNDTIVEDRTLLELKDYGYNNQDTVIIGSCLYNYPDIDIIQCVGGGNINWITGVAKNNLELDKLPDYITGASMFIKIEKLNYQVRFDENMFMYWEDVDLCLRHLSNGWKIGVATESIVFHKESASLGRYSNKLDRMFHESFVYFVFTHFPYPYITLFVNIIGKIFRRIQRRQFLNIFSLLAGIIRGWSRRSLRK